MRRVVFNQKARGKSSSPHLAAVSASEGYRTCWWTSMPSQLAQY